LTATGLRSALLVALCLLSPLAAWAAGTRISAAVDKTSVRVGETLRYTLTVETDPRGGDEPATVTPPDLSAWQVVSQQQRQTFVNGRSDQRIILGLQALQPGRVEIGPFTLRADGKTLKSQTFAILVVGGGAPKAAMPQLTPPPGSEPPARPTTLPAGAYDELAFLAWDVDRDTVWLGQPLTATLWVYVNASTSIQQSDIGNIELEGFWRESRPAQRGGETVSIRNTRFVRSPVAQYVLVPLRAGALSLPSVRGDFVMGERSVFGSGRRQKASRQGPALPITVQALPEAGKPADFRGPAVGQVRLEAMVSETQVDADHGVELTATTTVNGHLDHVPVPRLETPDFEVYPPTNTEQRAQQNGRLVGQRVTRWQLRPRKLGALTIPVLRLPHFDPDSGTWQTAVTVPMTVTVTGQLAAPPVPATAPASRSVTASTAPTASDALSAPPSLRPVRPTSTLSPARPPLSTHPLFALVVALPPLAMGADALRRAWGRRRASGAGERAIRQAASQAQRALTEVARSPQPGEALSALSRALVAFLEARLTLSLRGQTHSRTRALLVERSVPSPLADAVVAELENCEFARFAPEADRRTVLAEAVQRVRALVEQIDGAVS
jgi:hypothetical protein